jgi:hypothetical protein
MIMRCGLSRRIEINLLLPNVSGSFGKNLYKAYKVVDNLWKTKLGGAKLAFTLNNKIFKENLHASKVGRL